MPSVWAAEPRHSGFPCWPSASAAVMRSLRFPIRLSPLPRPSASAVRNRSSLMSMKNLHIWIRPEIEKAITSKTKAIIPVHLVWPDGGHGCDNGHCPKIRVVCRRGCLSGSWRRINGQKAGTIGDHRMFQLLSGKKSGRLRRCGAVVTNDEDIAQTMRCLRDHGQSEKYHHKAIGWNARMDGIQGAVLSIKLNISTNGMKPGGAMPPITAGNCCATGISSFP